MDVAADDAVHLRAARLFRQHLLEGADEIHRLLHLDLGPGRERPVGHAEEMAEPADRAVDDHRRVIGIVAEIGEPAGIVHDRVELVAMDDQHTASVRRLDDAAEMHALELAGEFVMVAGYVGDRSALARLAQQFLHHVVVGLRPVPGAA